MRETVDTGEPRSEVLEAPLPAHWRLGQRLKNGLIYHAVMVLLGLLTRLPFGLVRAFAAGLGVLAPLVARADRRRTLEHLAIAFPEKSEAERRRIMRAMFRHLGRSAAEAAHVGRMVDGRHAVRLAPEHLNLMHAALAEGHGVVVVTGHIGNWELLAQVVAKAGLPVSAIAKPTYDPRLTRLIHRERTRFGMEVIWRGDSSSGRDMLTVFKRNRMLALLIDQDTKVQGDWVPFFGKPAYTPTAAAALALRFGAPVLVAWHHRVNGQHELHVERVDFTPGSDREADAVRFTALLTARLEAGIREHPEQWVWMHRRWRRQPDAARDNPLPAAAAPLPEARGEGMVRP